LQVTVDGYWRAGEVLGARGLPTVVVQEGGYHLPTLGRLVGSALDGLAAGWHDRLPRDTGAAHLVDDAGC
jgi:acetoin utilization deacetylase AcuC-like enzyme